MSKDLIKISVTVAGRSYPIQVEKHEEADVKKAAKFINKKLLDYQKKFKNADKQDCMAMLLLTQQVEGWQGSSSRPDDPQCDALITDIEKLLHSF